MFKSYSYSCCLSRFATSDLPLATLYANAVKAGKIGSSAAMSAPSIEQILEGLEPVNRKMIEDRLVAMSTAAFSANEKVGPLEEAVRQSNNDLNNNDLNNNDLNNSLLLF